MHLEEEYRRRLHTVSSAVRRKLDYQVAAGGEGGLPSDVTKPASAAISHLGSFLPSRWLWKDWLKALNTST